MAKLWLPMNTFKVKQGNREMTVIIPQTGDRSYDQYLEEAEREKTAEELKKQQRPISKMSRADIIGALKEYRDWFRRRRR